MMDERRSLSDINIDHIDSSSRRYMLDGLIGKGGSSLVYKAYYEQSGFRKVVLIKELFPLELFSKQQIMRGEDGTVVISDDAEGRFNEYKAIAENEHRITNELRFIEGANNNEPYFFEQIDFFSANNTVYSILSTEAGDTLLTLLGENERQIERRWPKDLGDVCQIILRVLEALEPIHKRGKLHLDISPDNIFFSKMAVNGNRIAKMIDFNSVMDLDAVKNGKSHFSYKKGYSAIELSNANGRSTQEIGYYTDLYSVCAVMFRVLNGATTASFYMYRNAYWQIDCDNCYCKSMPGSAIEFCNKILRRGLSPLSKNRYQNISELRADLVKLYELCKQTPYSIRSNIDYSFLPIELFGREQECKKLDDELSEKSSAILCGIGGIGKTTLALTYARAHSSEYGTIVFLPFYHSVVETIIDDSRLPIYGISRIAGESDDAYYSRKLDALRKVSDESYLMILDGFDETDDRTERLLSLPCKVIMTTRIDYAMYGVKAIRVDPLEMSTALEMFRSIAKTDDENDEDICHLLSIVEYHTLTVELMARQVAYADVSAAELISKISEDGLVRFDDFKVGSSKDRRLSLETLIGHIEKLFSMGTLSEDERHLIYKLALFSEVGVYREAFNSANDHQSDEVVERLILLGWVKYMEESDELDMHPVIADAARKSNLCEKYYFDDFVLKCDVWMLKEYRWESTFTERKLRLQEQIIKKYNYASKELKLRVLIDSIGLLLQIDRIGKADEYANLAFEVYINEDSDTFDPHLCSQLWNNIGGLYLRCNQFDEALKSLTYALKYAQMKVRDESAYGGADEIIRKYVNILISISEIKIANKEYKEATSLLSEAYDLAITIGDEVIRESCLSRIYCERAIRAEQEGNHEAAFELLEKAAHSASVDLLRNSELYMVIMCDMSYVLCNLGEFKAAEGFARIAVDTSEQFVADAYGKIKTHAALARVYYKSGDNLKAYEKYTELVELIDDCDDFSQWFLIDLFNDFAIVCKNIGDNKKAYELWLRTCEYMYGTDIGSVNADEMIEMTAGLLVRYKRNNIFAVFCCIIMINFSVGKPHTSRYFCLLLGANKDHLEPKEIEWLICTEKSCLAKR